MSPPPAEYGKSPPLYAEEPMPYMDGSALRTGALARCIVIACGETRAVVAIARESIGLDCENVVGLRPS